MTERLVGLPDRLVPITMHHWTELIELDPIELQTKSISECGPAKWPSEDEKNASCRKSLGVTVRRRAARGVDDRRSSNGVHEGQTWSQSVFMSSMKHPEAF